MSRRSRQSRRGQKYSAAPSDLRHRARPRPVVTVNLHEVEAYAGHLRHAGFRCSECARLSFAAYQVDQAIQFEGMSRNPVPGFLAMLRTVRRELGPSAVVLICADDVCSTLGCAVPDGENGWRTI